MPLPKPKKGQDREGFVNMCMGNPESNKEFPDISQRFAVCNSIWDRNKNVELSEEINDK